MRLIVIAVALSIVCLGGLAVVKSRINRQESAERAPVIDYAGAAAQRLAEPDTPYPATPPRDYAAELAQILPQFDQGDQQTQLAALEVLKSLPGAALPAIRDAENDTKLKKGARSAIFGVARLFEARSAREQRTRDQRLVLMRELLQAYDRFGRHDPRWDARAKAVVTAYFRSPPMPFRTIAQDQWLINAMSKVIDDARCNDPAILFAYGCMIDEMRTVHLNSGNGSFGVFQQATSIAAQDNWPAAWQAMFTARLLANSPSFGAPDTDQPPSATPVTAARAFLDSPWLAPQVKSRWAAQILDNNAMSQGRIANLSPVLASITGGAASGLPKIDVAADYQQLHDELEKQPNIGIEPLLLAGSFYTSYAWMGRGGGYAATITEQGRKLLEERMLQAKQALEKAYEQEPNDPRAPAKLVEVCMGLNDNLSTTDQWFAHAMADDPDNYEAVANMLLYLEPKWHGNAEQLLKFARSIRASHNYRGRLALAVADAHERLAAYAPDAGKYLGKSVVWDEIQSAYESYLALIPADREQRTHYAYDAVRAGKWKDAAAQFKSLANDPWPGIFDVGTYDSLQAQTEAGVK